MTWPPNPLKLAQLINQGPYVDCDNLEVFKSVKDKTSLIGVYFSASWCPPCRLFTPLLIDAYTSIRRTHGDDALEIILVPRDRAQTEWQGYLRTMPWLSFPFNHDSTFKLKALLLIKQLPRLIIIDRFGNIVCEDARGGEGLGFDCDALAAYTKWARIAGIGVFDNADESSGDGDSDEEEEEEGSKDTASRDGADNAT